MLSEETMPGRKDCLLGEAGPRGKPNPNPGREALISCQMQRGREDWGEDLMYCITSTMTLRVYI